MNSNNKYRTTIYLGKQLHEELTQMANALSIPLSTLIKVLLSSGLAIEKAYEKSVSNNGK